MGARNPKMLILVTGHTKPKWPYTFLTNCAEKAQKWFGHQRIVQEFGTMSSHNLTKDKCKCNCGKYLSKIPPKNMADGDGQDMVNME